MIYSLCYYGMYNQPVAAVMVICIAIIIFACGYVAGKKY